MLHNLRPQQIHLSSSKYCWKTTLWRSFPSLATARSWAAQQMLRKRAHPSLRFTAVPATSNCHSSTVQCTAHAVNPSRGGACSLWFSAIPSLAGVVVMCLHVIMCPYITCRSTHGGKRQRLNIRWVSEEAIERPVQ